MLCPSSSPFPVSSYLCSLTVYQTFWSKSLPRRAMLKANDKFCYKLCENIGDFLKSETHEATQLFCLEQLSSCFRNLQTSSFATIFLNKLKDFFKVFIFITFFIID